MLLTEILYSCRHAAILLCSLLFAYSDFQNFPMSSLVGGSMMVIRLPCCLWKSFDCLFIKSLFCWYYFCLLWYLESLLLFECFEWDGSRLLIDNLVFCFHRVRISFHFWWRSWIVHLWYQYEAHLFVDSYWMSISFSPIDVFWWYTHFRHAQF